MERVRDLEGGAGAIGFGDSWFDLPMLRACGTAWSLRDSELWGGDRDHSIRFSEAPAQAGSEEVLARILTGLGER